MAHFLHLYVFRSMNVVSTSHGTLISAVVGGREARTRPSLGDQSGVPDVCRSFSDSCSIALLGECMANVTFAGAVVLPYTLSSHSSTLTSIVMLGRRANSRMVYLSSRGASVHNDRQSIFVSSPLEAVVSIMYCYNSFHMVIGKLGVSGIVLICSDCGVLWCL